MLLGLPYGWGISQISYVTAEPITSCCCWMPAAVGGSAGGEGIGGESQQGVVTVYSCSPRESSYEIEPLQHGAFTYQLLEGLRIQGAGNCATVERLDQYLKYKVPELNERYGKPRQTPSTAVEPLAKNHLILLPRQATLLSDVMTLKIEAFDAETGGQLELAKQLWTRVLVVSPGDQQAIEAIGRIARMPESAPQPPMESQTERQAPTSQRSPTDRTASPPEVSDEVNSVEPLEEIAEPVSPIEPKQSSSPEASKLERPSTPPITKPIAAASKSQDKTTSIPKPLGDLEKSRNVQLPTLPPIRLPRRRLLQIAGFGGAGIGLALLARTILSGGENGSPPERSVLATPEPVPTPTAQAESEVEFTVVTVNDRGAEVQRVQRRTEFSNEDLGGGIQMGMVKLPAGTFTMGSPDTEEGHQPDESPQREVTVSSFWMGQFQVTQAQWRAVAGLPKVDRDLDPNTSWFDGDDHPVESVAWHDAVEFCARLSQAAGREYRLPSEAEWEYACRAGTTTPFHFGETITPDLANYRGTSSFGNGPTGLYREETTPVGSFGLANAFGLYDMHGNVWEWCADHWHDSYAGAPPGGTPWIEGGDSNLRMLRGGSWVLTPQFCRSAFRFWFQPVSRNNSFGFRVVCSSA